MNALITGITGAGGSYLADYICENHKDVKVYGLHRWHSATHLNNVEGNKNNITLLEADLTDLSSVIRALNIAKPDKVFHLAAYANVKKAFETPISVVSNNILSTLNLLEAMRICCPDATLLIASTSEVYGSPREYPINEDYRLDPRNPYSVSKLASEKLAVSYFHSYGIKVIVTRAFSYINPRRRDLVASAFAYQVARIEANLQDVVYHGYLESIRSFIDCRDLVEAYWIASEKCEPVEVYHIGGGQPVMIGMLLSILKYKSRVPIIGIEDKKLLRPVDVVAQVPDVSKFYNQTGWTPKYTLDQSMDWLLNYYREVVENER